MPTYARVRYRQVYPGIDLTYYGDDRQFEYDFVVSPGADPSAIRIIFSGAGKLRLDGSGNIVWRGAPMRLSKPFVYQRIGSERRQIAARYLIRHGEVAFAIGAYDRRRELVIDPVVVYSNVVGGSGSSYQGFAPAPGDTGAAVAVDAAGNAYITGTTVSADFPTVNSAQASPGANLDAFNPDAFVVALDASGSTELYATYLGGGQSDSGNGIAVDAPGSAVVVGQTESADFPVTAGVFQRANAGHTDAFVVKLNAKGGLVYSSYLGGSDYDAANGVALDRAGNAYIAGSTDSPNFPTTRLAIQKQAAGRSDAFAAKMDPAGRTLAYSTYLGGSGDDDAAAIAVDSAGNAYLTGSTSSTDFPVTPGAYQTTPFSAFVAKLEPLGSRLVYSAAVGGDGIALDSAGNAYLAAGMTVSKLNPAGSALVYSQTFGTANVGGAQAAQAIAVDGSGSAVVVGYTDAPDFPLVNPVQATKGGGWCYTGPPGCHSTCDLVRCTDAFVTRLSPDGASVLFASYLGGGYMDSGSGVALDRQGNIYVAGTASVGFPVFPNRQVASAGWPSAAFVTKIASSEQSAPLVGTGAVVDAAAFAPIIAPGGLASIFGTGIVNVTGIVQAPGLPCPTEFENTRVTVNGVAAPILALAKVNGIEQINFQVPFETPAGWAAVAVTRNGVPGFAVVNVALVRPAFFSTDGVYAAAQHPPSYAPVTRANPAEPNEVIVLYATGLGAVSPPVASGAPAPLSPLAMTTGVPVYIAGQGAEVLYEGLAPGFVGLYQFNVRVPPGTPSGDVELRASDGPVAKLPIK